MTAAPAVIAPQVITGQADARDARVRVRTDDGAAPVGAGRGVSLAERGYVHGRFGGVPVLVGPELAAQLKALRQKQPRQP